MPKLRFDQYVSVFLLVFFFLFQQKVWGSVVMTPVSQEISTQETFSLSDSAFIDIAPVPLAKETSPQPSISKDQMAAQLTAQAVYVMDVNSGSILLEKNKDQLRAPASTTKMLTAVTARQIYNLDTVFEVKEEAFTLGNAMGLQIGEEIRVADLLQGLLIQSGNDAAFVLANNHPLGYQGFIAQMANVAQRLHLDKTSFSNPSGLDEDDHKTTAHDLAILAKEVMKDPLLRKIVSTKQAIVSDVFGEKKHYLSNTHQLLAEVLGVVGIKTGTTWEAGETLVTQVNRDGNSIIIVLMASQDRYGETRMIIDWVFNYYTWYRY